MPTRPAPAPSNRLLLAEVHGHGPDGIILACVLLPWLNPYAPGPSASVIPWLVSASCAGLAFALRVSQRPASGCSCLLTCLVLGVLIRSGWSPEAAALGGACMVIWLMAAVTAAARQGDSPSTIPAWAWMLAAAVSTAAGLIQYVGAQAGFEPWIHASPAGEAYANLRQRNQLASLTVMGTAAVLYLSGRRLSPPSAMLMVTWLAWGNAATTSRTGLFALLLLGVLTWCWTGYRSRSTRLWLVATAAYLLAAFLLPWIAEAIGSEVPNTLWRRMADGSSCTSRLLLWSNMGALIAEHPWFGWGWGELDFAHYSHLYEGKRFCQLVDHAHNLPLHVAVELGLPASIALTLVVGVLVWRRRPWRERDAARQLAWSVLMVLALHSMVEYPLWYGPFQMAAGLALGLLWPASAATSPSLKTARRMSGSMLFAGVVVAVVYAAASYHGARQLYLPPEERSPPGGYATPWMQVPNWLFDAQVRFARLTLATVTPSNARELHGEALALLHYSPEPAVIEKVLDSALEVRLPPGVIAAHMRRYEAAYPEEFVRWRARQASLLTSGR